MLTVLGLFGKVLSSLQNFLLWLLIAKKEKQKDFAGLPIGNSPCLQITKNLLLLRNEEKTSTITNRHEKKSLVVIIGWLSAKRKHTCKYAEIWMEKGFDVLTVNFNVWQLLWPVKGTQVIAADIRKFLDQDESYSQIILHGFSAGGYLWAEVMVQMVQDMDRYQQVLDRIVGQVWDSVADMEEVHMGVSKAAFPKNKFLSSAVLKYMLFHLRIFEKIATRHYRKASNMFHTNLVKAPALLIFSKTDPIGTERTSKLVRKNWESMGIKVDRKIFEKSPHVGHFRKYPEEYTAALHRFLDSLNLTKRNQMQNELEIDSNKDKL